jgi:hypothetical protein
VDLGIVLESRGGGGIVARAPDPYAPSNSPPQVWAAPPRLGAGWG